MRSSASITLLFVTSFLAVFGFEAFNNRKQYSANSARGYDPYSTTQPFYHSGGYPYYYDHQYHHWWYFGSGWGGHGMYGSSSISQSSHASGTSRGGFGSSGHGSAS